MNSRVWAAVAGAAVAFGTGAVVTRGVLRSGVEPYTVAALRALLAALIVVVILRVTGQLQVRSGPVLRIGVILSVFNFAVPTITFTIALQHAGAGFVGLLTALFPLASALFAHFMLTDERLTVLKTVGLITALIGVGILLISGDTGLAGGGNPVSATAFALMGVLSVSFGNVFGRRHSGKYEPLQMTGLQFAFGSVWLAAAMLVVDGMPSGLDLQEVIQIVYLAVVSTTIAFFLQFWLLRHSSASTTSLVGYFVPLVAVSAGLLFLDEQLQIGLVSGGVLILAGVVLTEQGRSRALRS